MSYVPKSKRGQVPELPTDIETAISVDYLNVHLQTGEVNYSLKGEKEVRTFFVHAGVFFEGVPVLCEVKGTASIHKQTLPEGAKFYVEYDRSQIYRVYVIKGD